MLHHVPEFSSSLRFSNIPVSAEAMFCSYIFIAIGVEVILPFNIVKHGFMSIGVEVTVNSLNVIFTMMWKCLTPCM